jgi:hypothetical protein
MTLRLDQVAAQLPGYIEGYRQRLEAMQQGLRDANAAIEEWGIDRPGCDERIRRAMEGSSEPYALSFSEAPSTVAPAPAPRPVVVVAADGSSIEPDRFAAVQCYVVNVGFIVLPYGLPQDGEVGSRPEVGPSVIMGDGNDDPGREEQTLGGWGVNLRRDVAELEAGASQAVERAVQGPAVLLLDGTLFPWDLDSRQVAEPVRKELRERTQAALDALAFAGENLAVGAYISGSRSSDVTASLRALGGRPGVAWPAADAQVFARRLAEGDRSAVFRAGSDRVRRVESLFSPSHQVCFFYLRAGGDIARVELPHWVAEDRARVDLLHATLVDQCARCGGYPRALQEAHEQAVISAADRLQFGLLLDAEADRQGLRGVNNGKLASKRRRAL